MRMNQVRRLAKRKFLTESLSSHVYTYLSKAAGEDLAEVIIEEGAEDDEDAEWEEVDLDENGVPIEGTARDIPRDKVRAASTK